MATPPCFAPEMKDRFDRNRIEEILRHRGYVVENDFRHYAVLMPMIEMEDGTHLLYEVRGRHLDRQPGEICFPGGEVEEGESFAECALRETWEEIGVFSGSIEILEELTTIYGVGRFAMHCFPAFVDPKAMETLDLNEEVDEVFTVAVADLMEADMEMYRARLTQEGPEDFPYRRVTGEESYQWSRITSPVPVFDMGDRVIWGLTGRATKVLIEALREAEDMPEGTGR